LDLAAIRDKAIREIGIVGKLLKENTLQRSLTSLVWSLLNDMTHYNITVKFNLSSRGSKGISFALLEWPFRSEWPMNPRVDVQSLCQTHHESSPHKIVVGRWSGTQDDKCRLRKGHLLRASRTPLANTTSIILRVVWQP
jgi:hypothetical protein